MKTRLLKYIFVLTLLISFTAKNSLGQTASFANITGGVQSATTPITSGQSQVVIYGFSAAVSGGSITFAQFNLSWTGSTAQSHWGNGTLFRSSTSTYGSGTLTAVGNVIFSGSNVTVTDLSETVSSSTNYYFLVADNVYSSTSTDYGSQIYVNSASFATDDNSINYAGYLSYIEYTYSAGTTPYPVAVANLTGGITSNTAPLTTGTTATLFGFSITNNSGSTYKFSKFQINSGLSTLSSFFSSFKLYRSTSSTYGGGTNTLLGTGTISSSYVSFSPSGGESVAAGVTQYYFLVGITSFSSGAPVDVQFNLEDGQSSASLTTTSPSATTYNHFTCIGNSYTLNYATVTVVTETGGTSATTITANQTSIVLFGFGISASSSITVSGFNINSNSSSLSSYFGSGKLVLSSTSTYGSGTLTNVGSVVFNGSYANVTLSPNQTITTTAKYYFLVANNTGVASSTGNTVAFEFVSGQSTSAVIQTSPSSSYNTYNITGNSYTLPGPYFTVTGENSTTTNGITSGNLVYGQSNIVLFGFGIQAIGSSFTLNTFHIMTSGGEGNYFANARLYRSTSPVFPGGTPLYSAASTDGGTGVYVNGGGYFDCGVSETIPAGTTYYYWLVANYSVATSVNTTFTCSFVSGQGSAAFITTSPYVTYNTYNVTGNAFNIVASEYWTGGTSGDITNPLNFTALNGGGGSAPGGTSMVLNIGGKAYTNAPTITASVSLGGLTFGTVVTNPTLNISSGKTLTLSTNLTVSSTNATISGGTVALSSTATSASAASSVLTLTGATLSNAGTYTMTSTSQINFSGTSTLANTGTFTLESDASGSATIGNLGSGSITGTFNVQRYIGGGNIIDRGYRIISSPIYDNTSTPASTKYFNLSFLQNTNSWVSGPAGGGFDVTGSATMYLYDESHAALGGSFYRAIDKINNSPAYDVGTTEGTFDLPVGTGIFYFFRGNQSTNATVVPSNVTLVYTGALNHGQIIVNDWYNSSSPNLSYTAGTTATGYNMVGNPYPSSIDWNTAYNNTTSTSGVYAPHVSPYIYVYNPTTQNYSVYESTSATGGVGTNGGSNIIPTGQGFFVQALTSAAQLIFNESAKVSSQPATLLLYASLPREQVTDQHLRLQLSKDQDTIDKDETAIVFNSQTAPSYNPEYDVKYLTGSGVITLANVSSDNIAIAIKQTAFPKSSQTIPLKFTAKTDGLYHLNLNQAVNIPSLYDVWLMDTYKNDSLDFKHNPIYTFNVIHSDTASISIKRFKLIIRQNPAYAYNLITFNGAKVTGGAQLTWQTNNDQNYVTYVLQKSTDKGKTFTSIDSLLSSNAGTYTFTDKKPVNGLNEYRLEQINDITDTAYFTKLIPLQYTAPGASIGSVVSVYPNPAVNMITLAINDTTNTAPLYNIKIINMSGSIIRSVTSNQPNWQSDVSALLPGTYFIEVINNSNSTLVGQSKFIKL